MDSFLPASVLVAGWWGLAGAVIYAAPKLSLCYFTAKDTDGKWGRCLVDFPISITIGAICGGAFSDFVGGMVHVSDSRAIAAVIGMIANTASEEVIKLVGAKLIKRLS